MEELFVQLNLCQSQDAKTLLSHPFGAWLLLFPGFVATLAKEVAITCERRHTRCARPAGQPAAVTPLRSVYSLRSPCGPACGCYSAALRLLTALALRASLRPLLRCAPFTHCACPAGSPAAITPLRSVCHAPRSPT